MTDDTRTLSRRSVLKTSGAAVAAAAGSGLLGSSTAYTYDCNEDPEAPSNLQVTGTTDHSVSVSWDEPTEGDVDHYLVHVGNRDDSRYGPYMHKLLKTETVSDYYTSADVGGLPFERSLVIQVEAVHADGTESGSCQTTATTDEPDIAIHRTCPTPTKTACSTWTDEESNAVGGRWGYDNFDEVTLDDEAGITLDYDGDTGVWWTKVADENGNYLTVDDHDQKALRLNVVAPSGYQEIQDARLTWNHCDDASDVDCGGAESDQLSYYDQRRYPDAPAGERQTLWIPLQRYDRGGNLLWDVETPGEVKLEFGRENDNASQLRIAEMWISG